MYKEAELVKKTTKALLEIAKDLQIVGRHDMKKAELIVVILANGFVKAQQEGEAILEVVRINEAESNVVQSKVGPAIIIFEDLESQLAKEVEGEWEEPEGNPSRPIKPKAYYIDNAKVGTIIAFKINGDRVISGMIEEIHKTDFMVKTKNGIKFNVWKKNVVWLKTSARWPRGVYLALKGDFNGECKGTN
jgi:hypothetical protein